MTVLRKESVRQSSESFFEEPV